eukprot:278381-Chlamydomonas_euryale.AAC.5
MASPRLGVGAAPAYDDVSTARSPPALLTSPFTLAGNRGGSSGRNSSSSRGDEVDASTAAPPAAPDAAATAAATNSFASAAPDTSNASATAPVEHVRSPSGADDAGGFGSRGAAPASSSFSGSSQTTTPSSTSAGRSNAAAGLPASERARAALLARSPSAAGNGAAGGRASQPLVLTPSRLRIDSRVLLAHTTSVWFTNSVFVLLILFKVRHGASLAQTTATERRAWHGQAQPGSCSCWVPLHCCRSPPVRSSAPACTAVYTTARLSMPCTARHTTDMHAHTMSISASRLV